MRLDSPKAWLGGRVGIGPDTAVLFPRQSRANLLIVGQSEESAASMVLTSILSLAAQQSPKQAVFRVLNAGNVSAGWHGLLSRLAKALPHDIQIFSPRRAEQMVRRLAKEVDDRSERVDDRAEPQSYSIVMGLQRAGKLRVSDCDLSAGGQNLSKVLQEGPEVGIHSIVWCNTLNGFKRILEMQMLDEFAMRVALPMPEDESFALIGSNAACQLKPNCAYYYDDERTTEILEKFRPYALPKWSELEKISSRICHKAAIKGVTTPQLSEGQNGKAKIRCKKHS